MIYITTLDKSIRNSIENIFNASRLAKAEYILINEKFDKKIIEAAEKKLNVSIWRPGGWDLNFVNYYKEDWFIVEIRLILQHAFYCLSGDEAIELITLDPELSKLVKKAKLIRPPELSNHIYF